MKRLHVHVSVENLGQSIQFYNTLFAAEPTVRKPDTDNTPDHEPLSATLAWLDEAEFQLTARSFPTKRS
jgi:hypothetical protein